MLDPIVVAAGIGLVASPVAGKALLRGHDLLPQRWRRPAAWSLVAGIAAAAVLAEMSPEGPARTYAFLLLLGALSPGSCCS